MEKIRFDPSNHTYWIGDKQLVSVTTMIKTVVPEFDSDVVSKRVADRDGLSQDDVLSQWRAKADASMEKGTRVHAYIEDVLDGVNDPLLASLNVKIPEMVAFDSAWQLFRDKLDAKVIEKETVVGDADLGVAGRVDVILSVAAFGGKRMRSVFDWKTGKFEKHNRFQNLLPPFDDLSASQLNKYSIQVSTYRLLLEIANPGAEFCDGYLVHLPDSGGHHVFRASDLRDRVRDWLISRNAKAARDHV